MAVTDNVILFMSLKSVVVHYLIVCIYFLGIWFGILRGITFIGIITNVSTFDV